MKGLSECEEGIVEREELMVSLSGDGEPTMRVAHFLQPTVISIDGDVFQLPAHCLFSIPHKFEPKKWSLGLIFRGCRVPREDWKTWVGKMTALHESTWRKAGIYEAILNSTYPIPRYNDLVLGLAEKWCPGTKSFIFSWGEATVTLEDMMVCGYIVLGSSVFSQLETEEQKSTTEKVNQTRTELGELKAEVQRIQCGGRNLRMVEAKSNTKHFLAIDCQELIKKINQNGSTKSRLETAMEDAAGSKSHSPSHDMDRNQVVEGDGNEHATEIGLLLEDRVSWLERIFAELKAARFNHR